MKLLICDDDITTVDVIQHQLSVKGFRYALELDDLFHLCPSEKKKK